MLMNIGSRIALQDENWGCFVFHDVDLVPEDDRNFYYCPSWPRHMSVAVNTLQYKLPYKEIFGGVSAIKRDHFELINGYSNLYFGWVSNEFILTVRFDGSPGSLDVLTLKEENQSISFYLSILP
jgi:hypothetical protein